MGRVVRVKAYTPGADNFGSRWVEVTVDNYGAGEVTITAWRPVAWSKFRVATLDNSRVLQENYFKDDESEVELDVGDTITIEFVVHLYAFRYRLNDDLNEEDEAAIALLRLKRRLGR